MAVRATSISTIFGLSNDGLGLREPVRVGGTSHPRVLGNAIFGSEAGSGPGSGLTLDTAFAARRLRSGPRHCPTQVRRLRRGVRGPRLPDPRQRPSSSASNLRESFPCSRSSREMPQILTRRRGERGGGQYRRAAGTPVQVTRRRVDPRITPIKTFPTLPFSAFPLLRGGARTPEASRNVAGGRTTAGPPIQTPIDPGGVALLPSPPVAPPSGRSPVPSAFIRAIRDPTSPCRTNHCRCPRCPQRALLATAA